MSDKRGYRIGAYYPLHDDLVEDEPAIKPGEVAHRWEHIHSEHITIRTASGAVNGSSLKVRYELCLNCGQVWRHP